MFQVWHSWNPGNILPFQKYLNQGTCILLFHQIKISAFGTVASHMWIITNIIFLVIMRASCDVAYLLCEYNLSSSGFIGISGIQVPDWDKQWRNQHFLSLLSTSRAYTHACIIKLMRCNKCAMLV